MSIYGLQFTLPSSSTQVQNPLQLNYDLWSSWSSIKSEYVGVVESLWRLQNIKICSTSTAVKISTSISKNRLIHLQYLGSSIKSEKKSTYRQSLAFSFLSFFFPFYCGSLFSNIPCSSQRNGFSNSAIATQECAQFIDHNSPKNTVHAQSVTKNRTTLRCILVTLWDNTLTKGTHGALHER